jgi:hypothetical protein
MARKKDTPVPEIDDEGNQVEYVVVERPVQKDGLLDGGGWEQKEVPKGPAMEQLSLAKDQRNAHWKNARLVEKSKETVQ